MDRGVFFDHGPMLGAEAYGRLSELARFLSPGLFEEPSRGIGRLSELAHLLLPGLFEEPSRGSFFFIFYRTNFKNVVEWGVHILVERQRIFNLGSLIHVSSVENNERMKRTATVARARPPICAPYMFAACFTFLRCAA